MPRGGARPNSGPKKGAKYRPRLKLTPTAPVDGYKLTSAQRMKLLRRQVVLAVSDGWSTERIAAVIGVSAEKLQQLFGRELAHGRDLARMEELLRLDSQSGAGKTQATKTLFENAGSPAPQPGSSETPATANRDKILKGALRVLDGGKQ